MLTVTTMARGVGWSRIAIGLGGSRLITRATKGRPHRFHDALKLIELAASVVVETLRRTDPTCS